MSFKFNLYTPNGVVIKDLNTTEVLVPSVKGEIDVLPGHTHILTELETGIISVKTDMGKRHFSVTKGLCKVLKDEITVLSVTSEPAEKIDVERAQVAQKKAQSRLANQEALTDVDMIKFKRKLERAKMRIRLGNSK